jgi:hypothetical protein
MRLLSGSLIKKHWREFTGLGFIISATVVFIPYSLKPVTAILILSAFGYCLVGLFRLKLAFGERVMLGVVAGLTLPAYPVYVLNTYLGVAVNLPAAVLSMALTYALILAVGYITRVVS